LATMTHIPPCTLMTILMVLFHSVPITK